jgi:hypothetical protein
MECVFNEPQAFFMEGPKIRLWPNPPSAMAHKAPKHPHKSTPLLYFLTALNLRHPYINKKTRDVPLGQILALKWRWNWPFFYCNFIWPSPVHILIWSIHFAPLPSNVEILSFLITHSFIVANQLLFTIVFLQILSKQKESRPPFQPQFSKYNKKSIPTKK